MKLTKLLPIVALSGIATVAMPLVASCGNGGDTPTIKTMTIMDKDQNPLPDSIKVGAVVYLAAFDEAKEQVTDAKFSTDSKCVTIDGNIVTANNTGSVTITCTASGYEDTAWKFQVTDQPEPAQDMIVKLENGDDLPDELEVGDLLSVVATDKGGASISDLTMTVDKGNLVEIDEEVDTITGLVEGEETITFSAAGYNDLTWDVEVVQSRMTNIINEEEVMEMPVLSSDPQVLSTEGVFKLRLLGKNAMDIITYVDNWVILCTAPDMSHLATALKSEMTVTLNGETVGQDDYDVVKDSIFKPKKDLGLDKKSVLVISFKFDPDKVPDPFNEGKFYLMG